jgi:hypothetical protein
MNKLVLIRPNFQFAKQSMSTFYYLLLLQPVEVISISWGKIFQTFIERDAKTIVRKPQKNLPNYMNIYIFVVK